MPHLCNVCKDRFEGTCSGGPNAHRLGPLEDQPWFKDIYEDHKGIETGNEYAYAHHINRDSFDQSRENGCVICDTYERFWDLEKMAWDNSTMAGPGYFSVFWVLAEGYQPRRLLMRIARLLRGNGRMATDCLAIWLSTEVRTDKTLRLCWRYRPKYADHCSDTSLKSQSGWKGDHKHGLRTLNLR